MRPPNISIIIIFLVTFSFQLKSSSDTLKQNEFKFTLLSENKIYIGSFDLKKYNKKEIEDIYSLIQFELNYTYSLKKAIETLENNNQLDPFESNLELNNSKQYEQKNKYVNQKYIDDSIRISAIIFKNRKWNQLKNETLSYLTRLNNKLLLSIDELKNPSVINYSGNEDTCRKIISVLISKDTVARIDLWGEHWQNFFSDRLRSLSIDYKNINESNISYIDAWAKFDIYCFVYWERCSGYYHIMNEMKTVRNVYKANILENKKYIKAFKMIFYKLEESKL